MFLNFNDNCDSSLGVLGKLPAFFVPQTRIEHETTQVWIYRNVSAATINLIFHRHHHYMYSMCFPDVILVNVSRYFMIQMFPIANQNNTWRAM